MTGHVHIAFTLDELQQLLGLLNGAAGFADDHPAETARIKIRDGLTLAKQVHQARNPEGDTP